MTTSWTKAALDDFPDLERFLIRQEARCVGFSAWLREKITSTPHIRNDFTVFIKRDKNHRSGPESIREAVLVTDQGLVYPVVTGAADSAPHGYRELSQRLHELPEHFNSAIGVASSVETIERLIKQEIRARVHYHLMYAEDFGRANNGAPLPRDIKVRQASILDALGLYELQKCYELEEVYLNPELFNETACYAYLKNCLRKEVVFVAERNGKPVAKVGTNARGYHVWQVGGVFTQPEERGKGICLHLMKTLLSHMAKNGKAAALFVKKSNRPAISLYKKLGFRILDDFRITYFKNDS